MLLCREDEICSLLRLSSDVLLLLLTAADHDIDDLEMQVVRYKPEGLDTLCRNTKFSRKELQIMYRGFKQASRPEHHFTLYTGVQISKCNQNTDSHCRILCIVHLKPLVGRFVLEETSVRTRCAGK